MQLTIRQLEILVAAADAETFTRAAQALGVSQPSLSEAIARIEEELGAKLFERTGRRVTLTAEGHHAVAVARELVRDFHQALTNLADRMPGIRGRIIVAALPSVACAVLPRALRALQARFPGIEVAVQDVLHERAVAAVSEGLADLALTIRPSRLDGLRFDELGADPVRLVCPICHPLAGQERVSWRDLGQYPFIGLARTSSVRKLTDAAFINAEVPIEPSYEVEQIPSAAALVEAGLGITALPVLTLRMFNGAGLTSRPLGKPVIRRHVGVVTPERRTMTAPIAALVAGLRSSFPAAMNAHHADEQSASLRSSRSAAPCLDVQEP
jgi:LysR family transcriptional regulator, carnitine catabolism transcriptional activator